AGYDGVVVVAEHHHQVIEVVVAGEALVAGRIGQPHRSVVGRIGGVVAPAVVGADGLTRHQGRGPGQPVGTVGQAARGPAAYPGYAVASRAFRADPAAPDGAAPHSARPTDPGLALGQEHVEIRG